MNGMRLSEKEVGYLLTHQDFGAFTSELNHMLKRWKKQNTVSAFVSELIQSQLIQLLINRSKERQALYTIGLIEYLCRTENLKIPSEIEGYAQMKLEKVTFYDDVEVYCGIVQSNEMKDRLIKNALPDFLAHNIVETSIEQVC